MNLKDFIRSIPDYPKKGILFRDITTLIKDENAFSECINQIVKKSKKFNFDKKFNQELEKINKNLTKIEKIKKYFVIKEKFSIENGMLTPTLKLKRYKIIQMYKKEFENLY